MNLGLMFNLRKKKIIKINIGEDKILHTFFCKTMDIYFYDKNKKLILTKYSMKPFKFMKIPKNTKYVIEMVI